MSAIVKDLKILLRLVGSEDDTLLKALVAQVIEWIEVECNMVNLDIEDLPRGLRALVIDMAMVRYGVLGKEGIQSENIVELSYTYNQDYPAYILRRLKRFRRIGVR